MGAPASRRVWRKRDVPAVYVGTYRDPAGMRACVFVDPQSGRMLGPMNLQLAERCSRSFPAPRVGAAPASRPGRLGLLTYYRVEWEGHRKGPDGDARGVFLRFEEGGESRDLGAMAVEGYLAGLLGDTRKIEALQEPVEIERAQWGLLLARHEAAAVAHLPRLQGLLEEGTCHTVRAMTQLLVQGRRGLAELPEPASPDELFSALRRPGPLHIPPTALQGYALAPPGLIKHRADERLEGYPEPDAGPFEPWPDLIHGLRAAGVDAWRAALRALQGAGESGEVLALGLDAGGRLAVEEDGRIHRLLWCSPEPATGLRFGDVVRVQRQEDRLGWAEPCGRNEAARAVELLRAAGTSTAQALLARAAEEGAARWEVWTPPPDAKGIQEALVVHPSVEHARRLERQLPGTGTGRERLGAMLAAVAAYWGSGAFEDAWILIGRMPSLLPETSDAPVLRAARLLHRWLEHGHVDEAEEEARNELSYVWDGTLGPLIEELGPALAGRCAELLENAGL
jgi:hypothetical protein